MAGPSTPQGGLRQRKPREKSSSPDAVDRVSSKATEKHITVSTKAKGETAHKITFSLITLLAFATRFWGISHPNEVVFDEVHFGKVGVLFLFAITASANSS